MKPAIGYIRVSSEDQADSGLGLEAQRQRIRAYCESKGLHLAEIFEDPGISGGKALSSRPAGAKLLINARRGESVIVVAKFDRLFRSVADAAQTIVDFDKMGIELVAIAEGFDMTNPYGRAMAQMASVFAELERAMIRERTRAAMKVKRSRRERMSHQIPFGWDLRTAGALVENDPEQKAIIRMKTWRAEGKSFREIARMLDGQSIRPKCGERWSHSSVLRILSRRED